MSTQDSGSVLGRVTGGLRHRGSVLRLALTSWRPVAVLLASTLTYLGAFLWALGDLEFESAGREMITVEDPWARMFEPGPGPFTHEPIALIEFEIGQLFFSPLNTLLGLGIALLVGLNLALTYIAVTQPKSCGIGASAGLLAGVPALLGGSACCAPFLLIVLGIQVGGLTAGLFGWLLPAAVLLLVITLAYVAGEIDPTVVRAGTQTAEGNDPEAAA